MTTIPQNTYDDTREVEKITKQLLSDYRFSSGFAAASVANYGKETLCKVLDAFKEKGWYCYYLRRFDGVWIELQIYNYDYQPDNDGLNKLIKY